LARVLALIPDLLFGSQVQGMLAAAGHEVELTGDIDQAARSLAGVGGVPRPELFIVDLDSEQFDSAEFVRERKASGSLSGTRTLGFYPHVDSDTRARAELAEFDRVVPRSRMAREGAELVAQLLGGSRQ
jgi:hypothetical protein